ncbi:N-acetyl-alpha-D-glucosaminyl L-malate synthase (GlcNAc-Mal synthase) (L-malic acid glycosyltransferase BshA), partial [Durusdinium trenchii]
LATNDPDRFKRYHPQLETVEVDGRGLDAEGRVRALERCIRRIRPDAVIPLGIIEGNDATIRRKASGQSVRLIAQAQGNLPEMLADLHDYRDSIDQVVCPGALTTKYLREVAGFEHDRTQHIQNGADCASHARDNGGAPPRIRLGYVGRMTQRDKRVLDLPVLCTELDRRNVNFSLTIAGDGPCRAELLDRLKPVSQHVEYLGPQSHENLYKEVFPNLDVLLLFSDSEAFGIVLAEAMMNGVVPVTSRYLGFESERLVVDGVNGLAFPVGDMSTAATHINRLADSPEELRTLSKRALEHANGRYTWQRCLSEWEDCLRKVIERPVKPPAAPRRIPRNNGRLDRLHVPAACTDAVRRLRRLLVGPAVPPGGEEWPLFHRHHSPDRLREIEEACWRLEADSFRAYCEKSAPSSISGGIAESRGLATWLDYLLPGLTSYGWRATLGLVEGPRAHRVDSYLAAHPYEDVVRIPCSTGTPRGRRYAVERTIRRLTPSIVASVNIPDAIVATNQYRIRTKADVRTVMTCHGIQSDLFTDMQLLRDQLDAVVCTNRLACHLAASFGSISEERVYYAPYGTDVPPLRQRRLSSPFTIAYSGRLEQEQKRVHDIPKILAELVRRDIPYHLLVAGSGPEESCLRETLGKQVSNGRVTFLGQLPAKDLPRRLYDLADALLLPSSWETGPIVVWEALSHGLPIVSSNYVGCGREAALCHGENCLMFDVGDTKTAARRIAVLQTDHALWSRLRINGWEMVNDRYSIRASLAHWNRVLNKVLALSPQDRPPASTLEQTMKSRLDRLLGPTLAEHVRRVSGRIGPDNGPGSEWPHALTAAMIDQAEFLQTAQRGDFRQL